MLKPESRWAHINSWMRFTRKLRVNRRFWPKSKLRVNYVSVEWQPVSVIHIYLINLVDQGVYPMCMLGNLNIITQNNSYWTRNILVFGILLEYFFRHQGSYVTWASFEGLLKHCYRFPIQRVNFIKLYVSLFVDSNKSYAYEKPRSRGRTIFFLSSKSDNIFMRYTLFCCGRQRKAVHSIVAIFSSKYQGTLSLEENAETFMEFRILDYSQWPYSLHKAMFQF